jgi:transcriptional regulator with XRE-family HTH domain
MKRMVGGIPAAQRGRSIWVLVGDRLRSRRAHLRLPVENVAEALGVEASIYQRYEDGSEQAPALLLAEMADILGVPVLWLFQDVIAIDVQADTEPSADADWPRVYRVATTEERVACMANRFRKLDFEGQQHLLTIAAALSHADRQPSRETPTGKGRTPRLVARRYQRSSNLQNSSRKSK